MGCFHILRLVSCAPPANALLAPSFFSSLAHSLSVSSSAWVSLSGLSCSMYFGCCFSSLWPCAGPHLVCEMELKGWVIAGAFPACLFEHVSV